MSKYLLITSDDFGVTHSVNRGILNGFNNGVLQSTNFMASTPWFSEAVKLTKENNLPVGVHLTLTCEWTNMKFGPLTKAKSLSGEDGFFKASYAELLKSADFNDIENEYRAQIDKVINMGIKPTHVETHMLSPMIPGINDIMTGIAHSAEKVAGEYGLIYTYAVNDTKLKYFDTFNELTHRSFSEITDILNSCKDGIHHLICHCAYDSEEQRSIAHTSDPVYRWASKCRQNDMDIITSDRFRTFLEDKNFKLIGIKQLLELLKLKK